MSKVLYTFVLARPTDDIVINSLASGGLLESEIADIQLMGSDEKIQWKRSTNSLTISLPQSLPDTLVIGFSIRPKP